VAGISNNLVADNKYLNALGLTGKTFERHQKNSHSVSLVGPDVNSYVLSATANAGGQKGKPSGFPVLSRSCSGDNSI
jgi:hypothetical protein